MNYKGQGLGICIPFSKQPGIYPISRNIYQQNASNI